MKALEDFLKFLKGNFEGRIEEVYLFGSYVRGDYTEESDVDLLVVGDVSLDELIDGIFNVLMRHGVVLNVVVEKPEEFKRWRDTSFHRTVINEGIRVY
ncbi:nucleotidyltransferase domain-containing protein [Thermococcus sp. JdF3]|uniref:nucleotidyltransferase domain-containing protein n=1 Tax=Thermococcus sp. JdF3 TaxID=1638258 RepID=UPI001F0EAFF5|nr:nucleotidyltransferase domain-containing protein [Thermococcus sp. JdF3]